tara:strand:- start:8 stop:262 length:255 start_codon:yes stop_codon:yes gene_type:complete
METKDYNGWANWETWNFNLWINNDLRLHNIVNHGLKELSEKESKTKLLETVALKFVGTSLMGDMKKSDIRNINFNEIIEALEEL